MRRAQELTRARAFHPAAQAIVICILTIKERVCHGILRTEQPADHAQAWMDIGQAPLSADQLQVVMARTSENTKSRRSDALKKALDDPELHLQRLHDRAKSKDPLDPNSCFEWRRSTDGPGYGRFTMGGSEFQAHVARWILENGADVPEGHEIHHTCKNRKCVQLAHLECLPKAEHRTRHTRRYCSNGHPYSAQNTRRDRRGYRICKPCSAERQRAHRERKKSGSETRCGSRPLAQIFHGGRTLQRLASIWMETHRRAEIRSYVAPWGDKEFAMMRRVLGAHPVEEVEEVLRAVIVDWASFVNYAVEFFRAATAPRYPTVFYLSTRNHFEAAVCWYRDRRKSDRRTRDDEVWGESRHRTAWAELEVAREAERAARAERLAELRCQPFNTEHPLYQEKLKGLCTPGTDLNEWISGFIDEDTSPEKQLTLLHQRATVEAKREMGAADADNEFVAGIRGRLTIVELESFMRAASNGDPEATTGE